MLKIVTALSTTALLFALVEGSFVAAEAPPGSKQAGPSKAAVDRTRKTVKMLDDIYKSAIVLITENYVNDENDLPAGSAFVALFQSMDKKGWHKVRLIDLTGEPYEPENVAKDDFEKQAAKQLKDGKAFVEQVVDKDGKPYLRAMTAVPVVMQKCVMCHPQYANAKKGAAIGAISYTLPIE
ncbi:MAG: DUF3365 domain-containing protein [Planctomycetota bacterium]|jgi:hypothetical protein|uniref:c-type heme family protein n=1 Tax=uncultured Gimesia sp. TaxID=1678688 RepID=UPI002616747C|nr:DUF3365 domain-containing protein [uncultured Gimesia sp.]